ncbi:MAG: hypothetical protein ACKOPN_07950 [Prochlorococcaceae cyanobacterium]
MQPRSPRTLLEVQAIHKTLRPPGEPAQRLFHNLSLSLAAGERLAIFAATNNETNHLFRCLAGIDTPDSGVIRQHGSLSWPTGMNGTFSGKLPGYENVRFALEIYGRTGRMAHDLALVEELAGIERERLMDPLGTYPGELKNRIAMALPLAVDFDAYLIAKLPGADFEAMNARAQRILELFQQERPQAGLLVAGTFLWPFPQQVCREGIALIDGQIAYRGDLEECRRLALAQRELLQDRKRQSMLTSAAGLDRGGGTLADDDGDAWVSELP